ncbi:MAG: glycerol-3-phosphate acyltransferase [Myxococcales bacterium]|nr:glycerol-3-phosphate acyltransferase [Myxococcales bacterium]
MTLALALAAAYAFGAIPFGLLLVRARNGTDVRQSGSGNIGATNVARVAGPWLGVLTLFLDGAKGYFAIWIASRLLLGSDAELAAIGGAAIFGHVFPIYLGFRGGKGVATAAGVFLALSPVALGAALFAFAIVVMLTRVVALGSLAGASSLAAVAIARSEPVPVQALSLLAVALIVVRHTGNLKTTPSASDGRRSLRWDDLASEGRRLIEGARGIARSMTLAVFRPSCSKSFVRSASEEERAEQNQCAGAGAELPGRYAPSGGPSGQGVGSKVSNTCHPWISFRSR